MALCQCGCGRETRLAPQTVTSRRWISGQPQPYLHGHTSRKPTDPIPRFWAKVNKNGPIVSNELGPCWLWLGTKTGPNGYGQFKYYNKRVLAHHLSYFIAYGVWLSNLGCHKCDIRLCIHPNHIFDGTHKENSLDAKKKGRLFTILTEQDVEQIRIELGKGVSQYKLASVFAVSRSTIKDIHLNKTWKIESRVV